MARSCAVTFPALLAALLACKLGGDGNAGSRCRGDGDCKNGLACQSGACAPSPANAAPSRTAAVSAATPAASTPASAAPVASAVSPGMFFDGAPAGHDIKRLVPLNRGKPNDLLVWGPPGWKTYDNERYDDLVHVEAPDGKAVVLVNSASGKVGDATRKLWTESLGVRKQSYGSWEAGTVGVAHWPARVSTGTGTLGGETVELFAVGVTRGAEDFLVVASIKQSASQETRSTALAIVKSLRRG